MNYLFRNFKRAIRTAIEGEFRSGRLGQLTSRLNGPRAQARSAMRGIVRNSRVQLDRYAMPAFRAIREQIVSALNVALRPIVNLLRGLLGEPQTAGAGGAGLPPRIPAVAAPGGDGFDDEIRHAIELLGQHGYEVTAPGRRESLDDLGFTRQREDVEPPAEAPFHLGRPQERVQIPGGDRVYDPSDPVFSGEMVEVESSNVHSIGFTFNWQNPASGTLKVRFLQGKGKTRGAGPLYHYRDVHPNVFDAFLRAASKGKFVWDRLRIRGTVSGHRFQYQLAGISNGYVPRHAKRFGQNEYFIQRRAKFRSERTGETREFASSLPDQFVQNLSTPRFGPEIGTYSRGTPNRGGPNRGAPNRGRP